MTAARSGGAGRYLGPHDIPAEPRCARATESWEVFVSNRHHRPRRHLGRQSLDDGLTVATFVEAALLAVEMPAAVGGCEEILAVVGADDRVVRMVIDPMIPGSARAWLPRRRVVEQGDERTLHVVVRPRVEMAPPTDDTVQRYEQVQQACENSGRPLLDMMLTDGDPVQSLSLALDPESPWLDDRPEAGT